MKLYSMDKRDTKSSATRHVIFCIPPLTWGHSQPSTRSAGASQCPLGSKTTLLNLYQRYLRGRECVGFSVIPVPKYLYYISDMSNYLISQFKELRNNYLQEKEKKEAKATRVRYDCNRRTRHPAHRSNK